MTVYRELEYLESTGTQWVDTGIVGSSNISVDILYKPTNVSSSSHIFGARNESAVGNGFGVGLISDQFVFDYNGRVTASNVNVYDIVKYRIVKDKQNNSLYADGSLVFSTPNTASTFTTTATISLFSMRTNTAIPSSTRTGNIYYCKIYDNGTLVRDFIPVLDFNNTPCMYDKVTDAYYYNQGTGSFNYSLKGYYCEVEYLESTGTQYIDTGFVGNQNTRIHTKIKLSANEGQTTAIFGSRILSSSTVSRSFYAYCVYSTIAPAYRIQYGYGTQTYNDTANVDFTNPIDFDFDKRVVRVNGTTVKTFTASTFTNPSTILLFNCHTGTSGTDVDTRYNVSRLYYSQIYDNGTLVRDFIPVLDWNMTPCLYDRVSGTKFYNAGTGEFSYGRKIYPVEYLESTGTQYIDTGVYGSNNLKTELKAQVLEIDISKAIFGAYSGNTNNYYLYQNGSAVPGVWQVGFNSWETTSDSIDTNVHTFLFDGYKVYDNGTLISTLTSGTFTTTQTLLLFNMHKADGTIYNTIPTRIYGCKLSASGNAARDYIPAIDENGVGFLFDRTTHTIYDNEGSGEFLYGPLANQEIPNLLLMKKAMMMACRKKPEYTPLKYLEGTGDGTYNSGQYIDTGLDYFADIEVTLKQRESASMKALGTTGYYCIERENATTNVWQFRNGQSTFFSTSLLITDLHTLKWKNDKVYGDGVELGSFSKTSNTGRMYLFGAADASDTTKIRRYPIQISSCRMWNPSTGELVRDYIPVLDTNGTPCMLDRVENKLYYNQGDGEFSYEEWDYTPVDYVYANGNAYTRTMLYGNSNTKMEMVFDIPTQSTQNRGIMGSRGNSANSQLLAIGYGTSVLASDFNNSSYSPYRASIDYDLNTKYRVYTSKEKRSIIDEATGTVLAENNTLCTNNMSTGALLLGAETGLSYRHTGNIYGAKVWDGSLLTRDYIPVVDGDNKAGFYDKCLNIISYSVGTSDFVGHFIENGVDYKVVMNIIASQVATSGNTNACPYIKTGIYPSPIKKTRMKAKAQIAVVDTSYDHFLGGTNAGSRFVVGQASASSSSMFYFGLGTQNYWTNKAVDTSLHIFVLDWETETCSIDDTTWQIPSAGTDESTKPFFINARSTSTHDNANRPAGGTSYWWKFYEGKKLVYNGIPVVRASDNKVGLFETVNRQFQTTAGTIEYTYTE